LQFFLRNKICVKNETFGFMSLTFKMPTPLEQQTYKIKLDFLDRAGNKNKHAIELFPLNTHTKRLESIAYGAR